MWNWTCGSGGTKPSEACSGQGADTFIWQWKTNSSKGLEQVVVTVAQANSTVAGSTSTGSLPRSNSSTSTSTGSPGGHAGNYVCPQRTMEVGVSVGLGVGVPLILALVLLGYLYIGERRKNQAPANRRADYNHHAHPLPMSASETKGELSVDGARHELPGS